MQQTTITLHGNVSKDASTRVSTNKGTYATFSIAVQSAPDQPTTFRNVIAFGKQASFAKRLKKGTRIKLVATKRPARNSTSLPLLNATFVHSSTRKQAAA
jgi:single-stranded DNA-binding protein